MSTPNMSKMLGLSDSALEEQMPKEFKILIEEIREDPLYQAIKNMKAEEVKTKNQFNMIMYRKVRKQTALHPRKGAVEPFHKKTRREEYLKCKYDLVYFAENYVKIATVAGVSPLLLTDKLRAVLRLLEASVPVLFMTSRQSSKTTIVLVAIMWYFVFWDRSRSNMINTKLDEGKKNLRLIADMMSFLPKWMMVIGTEDDRKYPHIVDNVMNKVSSIKSEMVLGSTDRSDPESSLRGRTGSLWIDETAYIDNIHRAFSAMAFTYNTYGKMSKETNTPAPFSMISTPSDIASDEGGFWYDNWISCLEVPYEVLANLFPWEIRTVFRKKGFAMARVEQYWYEFKGRADRTDTETQEFKDKYHDMLMNPNTAISEIEELDSRLAEWLLDTRSKCRTVAEVKRDIFCEFLSSGSDSIYEEEVMEEITRSKKKPISIEKITYTRPKLEHEEISPKVTATVRLYEELLPCSHYHRYVVIFDTAFSVGGDYTAGVVLDRENGNEIVATIRLRTGKVNLIHHIIIKVLEDIFNMQIAFGIERNTIGKAVVENITDDYPQYLKNMIYEPREKEFDPSITKLDKSVVRYGITTTRYNRPIAVGYMVDFTIEYASAIKDENLINELRFLVEKNGKIQAKAGVNIHDDLVMSLSLGLYMIHEKKRILNSIMVSSAQRIKTLGTMKKLVRGDFQDTTDNPFATSIDEMDLTPEELASLTNNTEKVKSKARGKTSANIGSIFRSMNRVF